MLFLSKLMKYQMCKRVYLEKFDLVCKFKLMESTCHVDSGFISTALGLVNVFFILI